MLRWRDQYGGHRKISVNQNARRNFQRAASECKRVNCVHREPARG
jgi:hypothetical protein